MSILPPPNVELPSPSGSPGGWGDKLEVTLVRFFGRLLNSAKEALAGVIRFGFETFLEAIEPNLIDLTAPILSLMRAQPDLPPEVQKVLGDLETGTHQVGSLLLSSIGGTAMGAVTGSIVGTLLAPVTYHWNRKVEPFRLDFPTLYQALLRDPALLALFAGDLLDQGWTQERINAAKLAVEPRLGVAEVLALWLRGDISETEVTERLRMMGLNGTDIDHLSRLAKHIPGPGDLVRFALREVWRDDLRGELLTPDAPGKYYNLMSKQGYAKEFAEDFWAAHWEIPAIRQGFEMFWRLPGFNEGDLRALLTRLDVLPAYHDNLIAIAYATYTRVDARRMYAAGVLSEAEVLESYRAQGYDPNKAQKLTDFAIADSGASDRELTKTDILNGYRDGLLSQSEASEMLQSINYRAESALFLLARVDAARAKKLTDAEVRILKDLFLNGDLTLAEVQSRLTALALPARQIELYVQEWQIDRQGKVKRPSRATLERLFKTGAITQDEFVETLDAIGYQDKYVNWYLLNISLERQAETDKEEERARKEALRLSKERRATEYQRNKASLDVEIAEIQAAISSADVALVETQADRNEALRAALPFAQRAQLERDYMLIAHDADAAIGEARIVIADLQSDNKALRSELADIAQSLATNIDVAEQVEIKAAIAAMRVAQARFTDAAATLRVEIARKKVEIEQETDDTAKSALKVELLELQVSEAEEKQAITNVGIDIKESLEQLGATMAEARRQELVVEQGLVKTQLADIAERIAATNASIAETSLAKTSARNAMSAELSALPGAAQALEIRQHYDSLIERIKAQVKELRVRLSSVRVRKALLTFEYKGPTG